LNIGWQQDQIDLLIGHCDWQISEAEAKREAKAEKERLAEERRQQQQALRLAQQAERQAEKLAKAALKEAKLTRAQFQRITKTVKTLAGKAKIDWMLAYQQVLDAINYGIDRFGLDWQAAINAAYLAAETVTETTADQYPAKAEESMLAEYRAFAEPAIDGSEVL
jgi:hypothetical protein